MRVKFKIHHNPTDDSIIVEAKTIDDVQVEAKKEMQKRGWKECDCWSIEC